MSGQMEWSAPRGRDGVTDAAGSSRPTPALLIAFIVMDEAIGGDPVEAAARRRSPASVGRLPVVELVPVVAVVDDQALRVEPQDGRVGQRQPLAAFDPARPPLHRGPVPGGNLTESSALSVEAGQPQPS